MDQKSPLYLRLPPDPAVVHDSLTIPMEEADESLLCASGRIEPAPLVLRRDVSLEEIADHAYFSFLTLGAKIGMGGLAAVYRMQNASDLGFALKVPLRVTARTYDHYALEARLLRDLRRIGAPVPELVSHGIAVAFPYLLMDDLGADFLQNPHTHHNSYGRVEKVMRVGLGVSDALAALHRLGYRHNDVKPANIHYALSGQVHLLDYASSSPLDASEDIQAFSPIYLAPERVTHEFPTGEKVDVFGLGTVLYELLTGHPAFMTVQNSTTIPDLVEHVHHLVKTAGYAPLSGYSPRLTSLVHAMLAYDPSHRPSLPVVRQVLHEIHTEYFG